MVVSPLLFILLILCAFNEINGHGYLVNPINRASRWRLNITDDSIPKNYQDNQYFCGGYQIQYGLNDGKCGPCGDNWSDPVPRSNENGGTYGQGVIVATYTSGDTIPVQSLLTANHLGSITYQLCQLEDPKLPETEECFESLDFVDIDTDTLYNEKIVEALDFTVNSSIRLPDGVVCQQCVLRWHYKTGNSWGVCNDGTQAVGCGDQETFRSCADIRIESKI